MTLAIGSPLSCCGGPGSSPAVATGCPGGTSSGRAAALEEEAVAARVRAATLLSLAVSFRPGRAGALVPGPASPGGPW
jgi:hypothetical protein